MRALEERLNVRLLHRTTRRIALTDEGRRYMERCEEAIDKLAEAEAELSRPDEVSGPIRITVPIDISKRWLARTLGAFADRHPSVRLEVVVTDEVLDLLANGIDLALRGGAPGAPGLVARKLDEGKLAVFASPQYAAHKVPTRKLSSLSGHVVFDPGKRFRGSARTSTRFGQIETRNFELVKALAAQSRGIALLPENVCQDEVLAGTLIRLEFDEPLPLVLLHIVIPTRLHLPARIRALVDHLASAESPGIN